MYLASHLWHYLFVYKLSMLTRWAEVLMKVLTIFLHTNILILILNVARCIFVRRMDKVQLVAFILGTNQKMMVTHQELYNDNIVELYAMIGLYLLAKDKPVWAAAVISIGFMKAGILLLLPTFLGFVQYYYGTVVLLRAIGVFVMI